MKKNMFDGLFDEISWFLSLICIMFIIFVPLGERIFDKNNDCEGFVLQDERGPRYGNKRKYVARDKTLQRRQDRVDRKRQMEAEIKEEDIFP